MTRILVVEDSSTQAQALRVALEREFAVDVAPDAETALARFLAAPYALVITDIVMPGRSGYDLCRDLKATPAGRGTPVILMTGLSDASDILRGLECGASNYVIKPFDPEHLLERVRRTLALATARPRDRTDGDAASTGPGGRPLVDGETARILDFMTSTIDDVVRANRQLRASRGELAAALDRIRHQAGQLQERVQATEERYRLAMESAPDAIVQVGREGRIVLVNSEAERLFGYPRTELLGQPVELLVPEGQREAHRAHRGAYAAAPRTLRSLTGPRLRGRRKDGSLFPLDLSVSHHRAPEGDLFLAAIRDTTEQQRLEEQYRQSQKMESLGLLAGGVAHDFNNLLSAIIGFSDLMTGQLEPGSALHEMATQVRKAGQSASALTRQLLAFGRKQVLQPEVLDLRAVVADVEKLLRRTIGENIQLVTALDVQAGCIRADRGQIENVLMNLAVNARDAMPNGGRLTIELANDDLDAEFARTYIGSRPGPHVRLIVADTGVGMTAAVRAQAFEPFFTTKGPGKGTGLGLATVYGIVKQSDGYIWLHSEPGRGTAVKIWLPRVDATPAPAGCAAVAPAAGAGPAARAAAGTVLLVEDAPTVRVLAREILALGGFAVLEAAGPQEAIAISAAHPGRIDLLLTDVVMPVMNGRDLARRLSPQRPDMKVLFMSGYPADALEGGVGPGEGYLSKPFTQAVLLEKARAVLAPAEDAGRSTRT